MTIKTPEQDVEAIARLIAKAVWDASDATGPERAQLHRTVLDAARSALTN